MSEPTQMQGGVLDGLWQANPPCGHAAQAFATREEARAWACPIEEADR